MLDSALLCLTLNLYHEARGESILGQFAVVQVVRNRAKYDPDKVCRVVFAPKQFSWTIAVPGDDPQQFDRLLNIAHLAWQSQDITYGATHYHKITVKPYWTHKMKKTVRIGNHQFYCCERK